MRWVTVYDFQNQPLHWQMFFIFVFLVMLSYGVAAFGKWCEPIPSKRRTKLIALGLFGGTFALILGLGAITSDLVSYYQTKKVYQSNQFETVEGTVEDFVPMPHGGHMHESFLVHDVRFEYSDYEIIYGFNNTKSHGGSIDADATVRIAYTPYRGQNVILKLEIAR